MAAARRYHRFLRDVSLIIAGSLLRTIFVVEIKTGLEQVRADNHDRISYEHARAKKRDYSRKYDPSLFVYTYFTRPDDDQWPTMARKRDRVGYYVCPMAAVLNKYGHDLRVLGLSCLYNSTAGTFSGTFFDGTVVKDQKVGGNRNFLKPLFLGKVLKANETVARLREDREGTTYFPKRDDVMLFVDGMDVLFLRDPVEVIDSLRSPNGGAPAQHKPQTFIAGEPNCHPYSCNKGFCVGAGKKYTLAGGRRVRGEALCAEMDRENEGRFNYANGGFLWGTSQGMRRVFDVVPHTAIDHDDQGMFQLLQLTHPELMAVETEMKVAYIGAGGNMSLEYGNGPEDVLKYPYDSQTRKDWPTSVINGARPVALHFNGDSKHHWRATKEIIMETLSKDLEGNEKIKASWIDVDNGGMRVECKF